MEGDHPLAERVKGTWPRPLVGVPEEPERGRFEACSADPVGRAYPRRPDGRTLFPSRRRFIVATPGGA
jgi:trans-aconitate 2-methyltransferase